MRITLIFFLICFLTQAKAQDTTPSTADEAKAEYEKNIRKSKINGVYIPKDLDDAFIELNQLSAPEAIQKFKNAEEKIISQKLHFGLGRWIIYNWNFYGGSRFSYYLAKLGVTNPDDMARFTIVSFHRHLNNRPLEIEQRIKAIQERKAKEKEEGSVVQEIITKPKKG